MITLIDDPRQGSLGFGKGQAAGWDRGARHAQGLHQAQLMRAGDAVFDQGQLDLLPGVGGQLAKPRLGLGRPLQPGRLLVPVIESDASEHAQREHDQKRDLHPFAHAMTSGASC